MGETRVDLLHLLEDLRDAYAGSLEETILTEIVANSLDSGAAAIRLTTNPGAATLDIVDDGRGMSRGELRRYHDLGASTKVRARGIDVAARVPAPGPLELDGRTGCRRCTWHRGSATLPEFAVAAPRRGLCR